MKIKTFEECLEFCTKHMSAHEDYGFFPGEIEEAAKKMYEDQEDQSGIDGEESEWFDEWSAWVEKNPGVMG